MRPMDLTGVARQIFRARFSAVTAEAIKGAMRLDRLVTLVEGTLVDRAESHQKFFSLLWLRALALAGCS